MGRTIPASYFPDFIQRTFAVYEDIPFLLPRKQKKGVGFLTGADACRRKTFIQRLCQPQENYLDDNVRSLGNPVCDGTLSFLSRNRSGALCRPGSKLKGTSGS